MIQSCSAETDRNGRETAAHGTVLLPAACYDDDIAGQPLPWHWHDELEAGVVTEGTVLLSAGMEQLIDVFGSFDENIKRIETEFDVRIINRGTELRIQGEAEAADQGARAIEGLLSLAAKGEVIDEQKVRYLIELVKTGNDDKVGEIAKDVVCVTAKGRPVKAKTLGQQKYIKAIAKNTITIGVGPAGTGKTYLAVAEAVAAFRAKSVNRIILTRPAVEAGERLGFLPGDLQNKVDPYLRPLYDALFDMQAVNGNNELRELFLAEKKEIERILAELSAEAAGCREHISDNFEVLVELDCIFARAKLSFAMVKDGRHRTRALVTADGAEIGISATPAVFGLVGRIQEETHRFAVTYQRALRSKRLQSSSLEQIPGVGPKRREQLLKTFQSVAAIRAADLSRLREVLPENAARAVYDRFHNNKEETS